MGLKANLQRRGNEKVLAGILCMMMLVVMYVGLAMSPTIEDIDESKLGGGLRQQGDSFESPLPDILLESKEKSNAPKINWDGLYQPSLAVDTAPDEFVVEFMVKDKGSFKVHMHRDWAPKGVDRFYNLVRVGFYNETYIFRSIKGFMMQFGISSDPKVSAAWRPTSITDDVSKPGISNAEGYLTFAHAGPNSRTTQVFINYGNNKFLDNQRFTPIGKVTDMTTVRKVHITGEGAPQGPGPSQGKLQNQGGAYIRNNFPKIDQILYARVL